MPRKADGGQTLGGESIQIRAAHYRLTEKERFLVKPGAPSLLSQDKLGDFGGETCLKRCSVHNEPNACMKN